MLVRSKALRHTLTQGGVQKMITFMCKQFWLKNKNICLQFRGDVCRG